MTTEVEKLTARYVAARRELEAASVALRACIGRDARRALLGGKRRTWDEASEMGGNIQQYRAANPKMSQRAIAEHFQISRSLVKYYLGPKCKAPLAAARTGEI